MYSTNLDPRALRLFCQRFFALRDSVVTQNSQSNSTKRYFIRVPQSLSTRPTADKKAWGLWDQDWWSTGYNKTYGIHYSGWKPQDWITAVTKVSELQQQQSSIYKKFQIHSFENDISHVRVGCFDVLKIARAFINISPHVSQPYSEGRFLVFYDRGGGR